MIDSCQNIDDMNDEEFIAYLISMGWAVPLSRRGKVRYAVEEPTAPTQEEVERICEDMVAEELVD